MKRVIQVVQNVGIIFLLAVMILIVLHKVDLHETVEVNSLLNLLTISAATQVISIIMDYITIRPIFLHMLVELVAMEFMVLALGFAFGLLNLNGLANILTDIFLIALVYILVVLFYFFTARYTAEEINQYLKNKTRS